MAEPCNNYQAPESDPNGRCVNCGFYLSSHYYSKPIK
jgi:hypothetical protein